MRLCVWTSGICTLWLKRCNPCNTATWDVTSVAAPNREVSEIGIQGVCDSHVILLQDNNKMLI